MEADTTQSYLHYRRYTPRKTGDSIFTATPYAFYFTGEVFQYAGYDPEWVPTLVFTNPDLHFHHQPGLGPFYIDLYATKIE